MDRDINAAINILKRGRAGLARTYAQGDNVRLQQEAIVKELRTNPATAGGANGL
jgi:transposase